MESEHPHGIAPYDLVAPTRSLLVDAIKSPLLLSPAERARNERLGRERRAQLRREIAAAFEVAAADWNATRARLDGNAPAAAVLEVHLPVEGDSRVECSECCEPDLDDTVPVKWPCATYIVIKAAANA